MKIGLQQTCIPLVIQSFAGIRHSKEHHRVRQQVPIIALCSAENPNGQIANEFAIAFQRVVSTHSLTESVQNIQKFEKISISKFDT
jgi:hypothetical protein